MIRASVRHSLLILFSTRALACGCDYCLVLVSRVTLPSMVVSTSSEQRYWVSTELCTLKGRQVTDDATMQPGDGGEAAVATQSISMLPQGSLAPDNNSIPIRTPEIFPESASVGGVARRKLKGASSSWVGTAGLHVFICS